MAVNPLTEQVYDPFTSYLQSLGLGTQNYYNPAQAYQINQYDKLNSLYNLSGRMATVDPTRAPGGDFATWAQGYPAPSNYAASGNYAASLLRQSMGWTPEQRAQAGMNYEPTYADGQRTSTGNISELQTLIASALKGRLGTNASNYVAGRLPDEQQRWIGASANGTTQSFLDYLRTKYNLATLGI